MKKNNHNITFVTTMLALASVLLLNTSCIDKLRRLINQESEPMVSIDENEKTNTSQEESEPLVIQSVESEEAAYTPLTNAIEAGSDGGEFRQLESGETVYIYPESEIFARNVWVKDHDGQVYYMDVSGCRMPSNQAPDGFFTDSRGAWDKHRQPTTEQIQGERMNHTYNDTRQGMEGDQWVFSVNRIGQGTAEHRYSFGSVENYNCQPLGINTFRLIRENDDFVQCQVVLMEDGQQVCISGGGGTSTYYAE